MSYTSNGDKERRYSNDDITVYWKPGKCIHVTTCYKELLEVFNPRKRPWINMQGAPTDEIIRVVNLCPTDALTFKWNNEIEDTKKPVKKEEPKVIAEKVTEVRVMKDGPLLVKVSLRSLAQREAS